MKYPKSGCNKYHCNRNMATVTARKETWMVIDITYIEHKNDCIMPV
jgi:hypothetical protein